MTPAASLFLATAFSLAPLPVLAQDNGRLPPPLQEEIDAVGTRVAGSRCTPPVAPVRKSVANTHQPDITDELITYNCPDRLIVVYLARYFKPAREMPMKVVLRGMHPALAPHYAIGASATQLRARLGVPLRETGSEIAYIFQDMDDKEVVFGIADGKIRSITWEWPLN
jgi:hypothetical protein